MKMFALATVMWLSLQVSFGQGLGIAMTNGSARVAWPLTGYHYVLQSATNLSGGNGWTDVGSASLVSALVASGGVPVLTNFSGNNILYTQRVANAGQFFKLRGPGNVPVCCFLIFYDGLLEFSDSATLMLDGLIHANGPIYTGPAPGSEQLFNGTVTTTSTITSPAMAGITYATNEIFFNASPPFVTNVPAFVSPVQTNNPHIIIEIPPVGEFPFSTPGRARLYNQAEVVLIVTNSPAGGSPQVIMVLQTPFDGFPPGADPAKSIYDVTNATDTFLRTNAIIALPFLSLTNKFVDQRQSARSQFVTQIDVNRFSSWLNTNVAALSKFASTYPTILYVVDHRDINSATQAVVRLVNGASLPYNGGLGFTVATQNPLYVMGNYNVTVNSITYAMSLGSTTNGATVPAALIADAITILSPNWVDTLSASSVTTRTAASMTVNAALLCGNVPSTGATAATFSGGVQNLPRFLENWTGTTLTLNTSLVCLYASQIATNQFQLPGAYYNPPVRSWGFDVNFLNPSKLPPGVPVYSLP